MGVGHKLKTGLATWLRPVLPASAWVGRVIWEKEVDDVGRAIADRRFDRVDGMLRNLENDLPALSPDPQSRVPMLNRLGEMYQDLSGDYNGAERIFREAIELGESSSAPFTAVALPMNNLGLLLTNQRRYQEAEPLVARLAQLTQDHLGDDDPEFASCLENLAAIYRQTGRNSEAAEMRARALQIRRSSRARSPSS